MAPLLLMLSLDEYLIPDFETRMSRASITVSKSESNWSNLALKVSPVYEFGMSRAST